MFGLTIKEGIQEEKCHNKIYFINTKYIMNILVLLIFIKILLVRGREINQAKYLAKLVSFTI